MRALVLSVALLISVVASAQDQKFRHSPPPGQPTGPITQPVPAPAPAPAPAYDDSGYDDFHVPEGFRRGRALVVLEREALLARMERMEELLERAMGRSNRATRNALRKLEEELEATKYDVSHAPDLRSFRRRPSPPPPPPAPVVHPISEDQLQRLIRAMGRESFGEGKLRVLETAAPTQYFLVPQVLKILHRFSFGQDKLDAVRVLWPRVLDRENAYQLYKAFTFAGEKEQLKQIIDR